MERIHMSQLFETPDEILGQEFLTWLWFRSDVASDAFKTSDGSPFVVTMEQRIVVQGGQGDTKETASVSGVLSPLREARFGLGTGKKVTRALLHLEKEDMAFQVSLKAEDFSLGGLKTPKIDKGDSDDDPDALFLEKVYLMEACVDLLDNLYASFLQVRLCEDWNDEVLAIQKWLTEAE